MWSFKYHNKGFLPSFNWMHSSTVRALWPYQGCILGVRVAVGGGGSIQMIEIVNPQLTPPPFLFINPSSGRDHCECFAVTSEGPRSKYVLTMFPASNLSDCWDGEGGGRVEAGPLAAPPVMWHLIQEQRSQILGSLQSEHHCIMSTKPVGWDCHYIQAPV